PGRSGVRAIRIAERNVETGKFLVLKNLPDHLLQLDVGTDGELAHHIAVFVGMGVGPEILFQHLVVAEDLGDAVVLNANGQRVAGEVGISLAEIVADDAVHDVYAVHFAGSGEHLAARQVTPLVRAYDTARLDPPVIRVQRGAEIAARGILRFDLLGGADDLDDLLAERIHTGKIGAHAFQHDLVIDVDHVRVAHLAPVHDVGHLHARLQFIGLYSNGEDADLAGL